MATATAHHGEVMDDHEYTQQIESPTTLMALNASEIDTQISTAKKYPRSIKRFQNEALEMVTLSEDIAGDCIYALPRQGKSIEGPSARFAEIMVSAWGNCRAGSRVVNEDERFVTSQGVFLDLQRNTAITYEVKRRITDKKGNRYKDDMVGVTSNAACSIALRNAVLKGIPKAFWKPMYDAARKTAIGDVKTLASRRASMLAEFGKMGVTPEVIFEKLAIGGEADITLDHLALLRGMFTTLRDGESTIEEIFSPDFEPTSSKVRTSKLNEIILDGALPKKSAPNRSKPVHENPRNCPQCDAMLRGETPDETPAIYACGTNFADGKWTHSKECKAAVKGGGKLFDKGGETYQ